LNVGNGEKREEEEVAVRMEEDAALRPLQP
jgi:hypothetical protein